MVLDAHIPAHAPVNIMLAGVGGQGIILAADVLALVGVELGLDVKTSEIHGMAQRGGSVVSQVRWGERVYSPTIAPGEVDLLVALERLEALRYADQLRPGGTMVVSDHRIVPVSVSAGDDVYPDAAAEEAALVGRVTRYLVPALQVAEGLGNARVSNVVLLGALSALLPAVDEEIWLRVVARRVPARFVELNRAAFLAGRALLAVAQPASGAPA